MAHKQGGSMTTSEIINLLQSDFEFGINFIIDNNPSAVESNISSLSIPLPQNPSNLQLKEVIDTLLQDGSDDTAPEKVKEIILVPYIDTASNYTGELGTEISSLMPEADKNASGGLWVGLISGILSGVANVWGAYKQEDILEIQAQMQQDQIAFELEKIERTKILGIPQAVFLAVIVFIMFAMLIVFLSNRK
tara:strand:- start:4306 stop:4881 length:576 start_codon:yes stop_codon:yes gene_type:complete